MIVELKLRDWAALETSVVDDSSDPERHLSKKVNDSGLIPRPRHGHRAVAVRELMIVFGGGNEGIVDELHAYNTVSNQWFCPVVKGDVPPGAAAFGLAADNTRLLFHGGMIEYGLYSNNLYELHAGPYFATGNISSKWEWKKLKPKAPRFAQAPAPRLGHSFTFINSKCYLFGGLCQDVDPNDSNKVEQLDIRYSNDLYVLDFRGNGCFWEMPHTYGVAPTPRESHTAVGHIDSLGNPKLIIHGGMAGFRLGDINILDLSSMTWSQPEVDGPKPLPRSLHSSSVVGDKMYVFGGWVPIRNDPDMYEQKWECTNSLSRLNLNTYKWEEIELDCKDGCPQPRAGHCAVVVGSRIYIWSGRDGYTRAWDVQVCCKDLWFLEVGKPGPAGKAHLVKAGTRMLELSLPEVPFCDHYILQIMPYSVSVTLTPVDHFMVEEKKRKIQETDWADDDVGPMLPTSPLPVVPLPLPPPAKAVKPSAPISICEEPLPSFLLPSPKPPVQPIYSVPPPKPLPRLPTPLVQSPMVQLPQRVITKPLHLPPQMSQHHNVVRCTAPPPHPSNSIQYVPVHEFTRHFPKPDTSVNMQMRHPGMIISKPFRNSASPPNSMFPGTMDFSQLTPVSVRSIPQRATVVKVMNPSLGSFSNIKVQPPPQPQVFSAQGHQVPPSKHTIVINKPVNKLPGQQIDVVLSSASGHRPTHYQTIQTIARSDANYFPPQKQMKVTMGNGVRTFPVHMRLPASAPTRVQVQNPAPMYKNVKLQVNGKTLTVMMPLSTAAATPVTSTPNKVGCYQSNSQGTVLTTSCLPKVTVCQEPSPDNPPKQVTVVRPDAKLENSTYRECGPSSEVKIGVDVNVDKKQASQAVKAQPADELYKVIGQPKPSCSGIVTKASSKSGKDTEPNLQPEEVLELPNPPSNIKISKTPDGAVISWTPPSKGPVSGYSVNLGVKADEGNSSKITFINVYSDVQTKTKILQDVLDRATLSFPKPTIIFRVSARNELGYGPATQVRWLQDSKNDCVPGPSPQSDFT